MNTIAFETRRAGASDARQIAAAHLDSIRTLGALAYETGIVNEWGGRLTRDDAGDIYVKAMDRGEIFHIAIGALDGTPVVLGFASHRMEAGQHRTAVYVRGAAARCGVGSALFRLAEAEAVRAGARSLHVDASLASVDFYKANGFEEVGRGEHRLRSGKPMACVFMRKQLTVCRTAGA